MKSKILLVVAASLLFSVSGKSQGMLGKLKQKAADAAEKALEKKSTGQSTDDNSGNGNQSQDNGSGNNSDSNAGNRPTNKGGGGLVSTPPDVNQNLTDAETAYKSKSYGEARYAVQQAMLGVELEIGKLVLKSLPESVSGLKKDETRDQVTSTGYGWAGLTILREYTDSNNEKMYRATIANNSAWMSAVNMYMANGGYAQQTNGQQNWKQVKVKNYKAIIEYDESSGYKLSVPLGQTSLIVFEAINYATEKEVMDSANLFDIDGIKKTLGEK
jgi:hypothetical protein